MTAKEELKEFLENCTDADLAKLNYPITGIECAKMIIAAGLGSVRTEVHRHKDGGGMKNRLREVRGDRAQKAVANAVGIRQSALCHYELGDRRPKDDIKIRLARYYGVTVGWLFFDEEEI